MADIAGSVQLWNRYPELMSEALDRHDRLAAAAVSGSGGEIFKHTGDGFIAAFPDVSAAVAALTGYQQALAEMSREGNVEIRSRVCIHLGPGEQRHNDWFGPTINHLARMTDLVAPTHVVLSERAATGLGDGAERLDHLGVFSVRDVPGPVSLYAAPRREAIGPALTIAAGRGLRAVPDVVHGARRRHRRGLEPARPAPTRHDLRLRRNGQDPLGGRGRAALVGTQRRTGPLRRSHVGGRPDRGHRRGARRSGEPGGRRRIAARRHRDARR